MTSDIKTEAATDAAKLLAEAWGTSVPVDPVSIARAAGLQVLEASLSDNIMGALVKKPNEDPTILLNEKDSPNRRRFTCAHELGHYRRRSGEEVEYTTVDLRQHGTENDPEEIYADEFAACLLMPERAVRQFANEGLGDIEMAIRFAVTRDAMRYRLKSLGLAS